MTLVLGARCTDGVVLAADHKLTGLNPGYGNKITGELTGVLTGFAGDRGNFGLFTTGMKKYVDEYLMSEKKNIFQTPYPSINILLWEINRIKSELPYHKFDVLVAVSGVYFKDKKSQLHHLLENGGIIPINQTYVAVGTGEPFGSFFMKQYFTKYEPNMSQFAQLADFVIRFVSEPEYDLTNGEVGLDSAYPYPQIIYIPDKPTGKIDHELTEPELKQLKTASDERLKNLYDLSFSNFDDPTVNT